jgi:hypothetical protein
MDYSCNGVDYSCSSMLGCRSCQVQRASQRLEVHHNLSVTSVSTDRNIPAKVVSKVVTKTSLLVIPSLNMMTSDLRVGEDTSSSSHCQCLRTVWLKGTFAYDNLWVYISYTHLS